MVMKLYPMVSMSCFGEGYMRPVDQYTQLLMCALAVMRDRWLSGCSGTACGQCEGITVRVTELWLSS